MKSISTATAIFTLSASAAASRSRWSPIQAFNAATGESVGYLWSEDNGLKYPDPVYGDQRYDFMFTKDHMNNKAVEVSEVPNTALLRCARESPSPCFGDAYLDVGGGEWEAGHYLVRGGFRYNDTPGYKPDNAFTIENYNNATGEVDFVYLGSKQPYAFFACGDLPTTQDDEPNGDLFIKYASEPTPSECQDINLKMRFEAGTGTMNWEKSYECMVFNHGIC